MSSVPLGQGRADGRQSSGYGRRGGVGLDSDEGITDDELTALALAADPDQPVAPDAVAISLGGAVSGLLPEWYMPAPMSAGRGSTRRWLLAGIVLLLVVINGAGLCVTCGFPEIAW